MNRKKVTALLAGVSMLALNASMIGAQADEPLVLSDIQLDGATAAGSGSWTYTINKDINWDIDGDTNIGVSVYSDVDLDGSSALAEAYADGMTGNSGGGVLTFTESGTVACTWGCGFAEAASSFSASGSFSN